MERFYYNLSCSIRAYVCTYIFAYSFLNFILLPHEQNFPLPFGSITRTVFVRLSCVCMHACIQSYKPSQITYYVCTHTAIYRSSICGSLSTFVRIYLYLIIYRYTGCTRKYVDTIYTCIRTMFTCLQLMALNLRFLFSYK